MVILTDKSGRELRFVEYAFLDIDMNDTKDFKFQMPAEMYETDLISGARIFKAGTEYGGIIGGLETLGADGLVNVVGRTWRGVLDKKIISPPSGQDYRIVSGDVGTITQSLLTEYGIGSLFKCEKAGVSVTNFKFDRYCTLYAGLVKLYKKVKRKVEISYVRGERGAAGHVLITPSPIIDYSAQIEISKNDGVYFSIEARKDRVNHLVCLGGGELKDRTVIHLYVNAKGEVVRTPYYKGVNDVSEVYDYPSIESAEELLEKGTEKLLDETNYQTLNMEVNNNDFPARIGDKVGGRDYITGVTVKQPITNIIYREERGVEQIQYIVEGDIATSYNLI